LSYKAIREYGSDFRSRGFSENTVQDRYELLMRVESDLGELDGLTANQLSEWLTRGEWAAQTQATYYGHMRAYYRWALEHGRVEVDPLDDVKRPSIPKSVPRPARIKDYEQVMTDAEHRIRLAATLARFAGLGAMEIANLQRSDVDDKYIQVRNRKGVNGRIASHPAIWELVHKLPEGHVLLSVSGRPFTPAGLSHMFGTRMRELGIADLTLNKLKHLHAIIARLEDEEIAGILAEPGGGNLFYGKNPEAFRSALQEDVNARDLAAIAFRRAQLLRFRGLLNDAEYFERERAAIGKVGPERVWQDFLELNPWILGVSAGGQIFTSWDSEKLEQTVKGASIFGAGKRVDALLRTAGRIRSLVLAEIKHHKTDLLHPVEHPYRKDCWAISYEVSGGITQIQQTVDALVRGAPDRRIAEEDEDGNEVPGEFTYVIRPRSYLIAGTLSQFYGPGGGINRAKYHSFELYRRNLYEPEVVTFDELLARAEWHVLDAEAARRRS
jgi:hypothetical protein